MKKFETCNDIIARRDALMEEFQASSVVFSLNSIGLKISAGVLMYLSIETLRLLRVLIHMEFQKFHNTEDFEIKKRMIDDTIEVKEAIKGYNDILSREYQFYARDSHAGVMRLARRLGMNMTELKGMEEVPAYYKVQEELEKTRIHDYSWRDYSFKGDQYIKTPEYHGDARILNYEEFSKIFHGENT